ncbi:MAG: DUF4294 domain-containing protein [Bacteroidetes bacterium]|nr:DUF4294 domain-containing protein [Bacteroidota bacterium]
MVNVPLRPKPAPKPALLLHAAAVKHAVAGLLPLFVLILGVSIANAQNWVKAIETPEGDTLVRSGLSSVTIRAEIPFDDEVVRAEYYRIVTLRRDVERVRPYAEEAAALLQSLNADLDALEGKRERQALIKEREGQIQLKLEARLQQLTRQQGEIMVKLIHRETDRTVHEWMQTIKGKTAAFYWQNMAKTGGISLKSVYDPAGVDREIERILRPKPY